MSDRRREAPSHRATAEQNVYVYANGNIKGHEQGTISVEEQRLPHQATLSWDNWESGPYRNVDFDLPACKTLIVQTVGISAVVESGQAVAADVTFQGAGVATIPILMTKQSGFAGSGDYYVGSMSLTGYSKGTFGLLMHAERNSATGNGGKVSFSVSGYLVDSPLP
jgi:hypothetical protein